MNTKTFEIRDRGTCIPALAVKLEPACEKDRRLLRRAGFSLDSDHPTSVLLTRLEPGLATYDPFGWNDRTMSVAHQYIEQRFDDLLSGEVIDVEFILGETQQRKVSEVA